MRPICSLLIPTRHRVEALQRAVASWWAMADAPERVEIIVRVHEDDPETLAWAEGRDRRVRVVVGDTEEGYGSSDKFLNCIAAVSNGDWLMGLADNVTVLTRRWDTVLKDRLAEPRKECLLLTARVLELPSNRIPIMSRGLYDVVGDRGHTEHADSYVDALAGLAGIREPVEIVLSKPGAANVCERDRVKTWAEFRGDEVAHQFKVDKVKLAAVLGRAIDDPWTTSDMPEEIR